MRRKTAANVSANALGPEEAVNIYDEYASEAWVNIVIYAMGGQKKEAYVSLLVVQAKHASHFSNKGCSPWA